MPVVRGGDPVFAGARPQWACPGVRPRDLSVSGGDVGQRPSVAAPDPCGRGPQRPRRQQGAGRQSRLVAERGESAAPGEAGRAFVGRTAARGMSGGQTPGPVRFGWRRRPEAFGRRARPVRAWPAAARRQQGAGRRSRLAAERAESAALGEAGREAGEADRWAVQGSNLRPPACKAGALPAELTARRPERYRYFSSSFSAAELMQYRTPVGCGPSGKTWPRWPPQLAHSTSVRSIPKLRSCSSSTASSDAGA